MKKFVILGLILYSLTQAAYALDVVYPKQKNVVINAPATFFIGSSDYSKQLTINEENINIHPSNGFAHKVNLNIGENTFILKSGEETLNFKITRPAPKNTASNNVFKEYSELKYLKTVNDNMPLRSTPIDAGANRIAHLQTGIPLIADGEKNGFYRIKLGDFEYGWFAKSYVNTNTDTEKEVFLTNAKVDEDNEFIIYTFELTGRIPWSIIESNETLDISIYNIKNAPYNHSYSIKLPISKLLNGKNLIGYSAKYNGNNFVVKVRKPLPISEVTPLSGVTVTIDAGHGGSELGAIGCLGDKEKDITLLYAKDLASELKKRGANVKLTRNKDEYLGLKERVDITNENNSSVFISLHGNAIPDGKDPLKTHGTEIYYFYNQSKPLANEIMASLVSKAGVKNNGIIQQSFAVIRNTEALSLLIEIGYLINPEDNATILNENFRKKAVEAISDGLENYFKSQI